MRDYDWYFFSFGVCMAVLVVVPVTSMVRTSCTEKLTTEIETLKGELHDVRLMHKIEVHTLQTTIEHLEKELKTANTLSSRLLFCGRGGSGGGLLLREGES